MEEFYYMIGVYRLASGLISPDVMSYYQNHVVDLETESYECLWSNNLDSAWTFGTEEELLDTAELLWGLDFFYTEMVIIKRVRNPRPTNRKAFATRPPIKADVVTQMRLPDPPATTPETTP